jgi:hypothetical protein
VIRGAALALLIACARIAAAAPTAEEAFQSALAASDIDALEKLGAERPTTRWTDDAWSEAARLALRTNDLARARHAFEQVVATGTDAQLVRRAKGELARLTAATGATGEWTAIAAEHDRLVAGLYTSGDPRASLAALGDLVRANPAYPRRVIAMLTLASVWEREGEGTTAVAWLRDARAAASPGLDQLRAHAELIRTLIRTGSLAVARDEIATLESVPPTLVAALRAQLERAELRRTARWGVFALLVLLAITSIVMLRRVAGSWRAAVRRLTRPPIEAIYLLPIAIVLVVVAQTGNPLVARAVTTIVIAGLVVTWVSGVILADRVTLRRALLHALCAVLAVSSVTYLAVDDGHLIDFVFETWRAGHERG